MDFLSVMHGTKHLSVYSFKYNLSLSIKNI